MFKHASKQYGLEIKKKKKKKSALPLGSDRSTPGL